MPCRIYRYIDLFEQFENPVEGADHVINLIRFVIADFHPRAEMLAFRINDHALEILIVYKAFQQAVDFRHHIDVHHID